MACLLDADGIVTNSAETYWQIAKDLLDAGSCLIGWAEGRFSHYNLLFTYGTPIHGLIASLHPVAQASPGHILGVSITGIGSAFFVLDGESKHPNYIAEKLGVDPSSVTTAAMADLINGVEKALTTMQDIMRETEDA